MSNILIVESKNDRIFFDALIDYLNLPIETEIIVNEYETLDGLSFNGQMKTVISAKRIGDEICPN